MNPQECLQENGRLIVIDLARHDSEWLRSDKAHRRLGFTDHDITAWFDEAGIALETISRIEGDQFTICVWVGRLRPADGNGRNLGQNSNIKRLLAESVA